jgi:hypothetical protein
VANSVLLCKLTVSVTWDSRPLVFIVERSTNEALVIGAGFTLAIAYSINNTIVALSQKQQYVDYSRGHSAKIRMHITQMKSVRWFVYLLVGRGNLDYNDQEICATLRT